MNTPNDGGPAFPVPPKIINHYPSGNSHWTYASPGMTLREWFAGQALAGETSCQNMQDGVWSPKTFPNLAERCYLIADAMLAARSQKGTP